ncbi:TolC family outer membrane protein [Sulfurospirillum halorespirans]|uniref:TolC Type I secretion outer membrane protein n=1 Tax=Sulfurospirillum halorespirans DSM 13726 TaxID=1193502 RepID=A0A1D7TIJ9_9BACT|nr:TolC family outer membrane protein [Sulfurospirillum halorespirans]AOO64817.1 TolC Type I secretion outer membrane protein [Sulfurospirillum halorespirans DSM 13726]
MNLTKVLSLATICFPVFAFSLTLEEGATSILSSNPTFKESVEVYNGVLKEYNIAENGYLPTLDLVGSYGYQDVKTPSTNQDRVDGAMNETSLVLTENIFNGFLTENTIKQQKNRLDAAAFGVAERADRTLLKYVNAYIMLLKQKELLVLSQENVKTHEAIFKQIKERSDSGFGRLSETQQAGSRYTLAQSNMIAQENDYKDAVSTFEKLYGQKLDADDLAKPLFTSTLPVNFDKIKDKSLSCNPSVRVQQANVLLADALYEGSKAAFYPKIDAELAATKGNDLDGIDGRTEKYTALIKLRYNLYNKGSDLLTKEKYSVLKLKENETLGNIERELNESIKFSWENYQSTQQRIKLLKEHTDYSKKTLDSYQQEFSIGKRDLINLLDAEGEYYSARQALATAEATLLYAKYRLLDNMGVLTDSFDPDFAQNYHVQTCSSKSVEF